MPIAGGRIKSNVGSHFEVHGVHPQLEGVLLAQIQQSLGQVVDLTHSQGHAAHHLTPMGCHRLRAKVHARPVREVDLGLWVDEQQSVVRRVERRG